MPLLDDPSATQSLLVPRGYTPLPGSDEETHPIKPAVPVEPAAILPAIAPTFADKIMGAIDPFFALGKAASNDPTVSAAFRSENTIGSAIAKAQDTYGVTNDLNDPNYSPWTDVVGTKYEQYWKGTFSQSNNKNYTEALKRSIDRQEADRRTVDGSGALGYISGMVAGTIDPTLLMPVGGEISLAGKGVWSVGRGAVAGARAGAIGTAAYETALQGSQDIRTAEESFANIGTGVVLGAVLGGTIAGALSRTQRVASEAALEHISTIDVPGSVGAAAAERMTLDDLTINGKITNNIAAGTAFSPNLRGNFRESPLARQTYQEIATNTLRQNMHDVGLSLGPSVETNINVSLGETIGQALERHPQIFQEGKKAGFGMNADAFDQAVGAAMRRGDEGVNTYVTQSAKLWRSTVVEPLTKQAIDLGLLPEDVKITEAPSYFSRMYNTEKMTAEKPQFMQITTDHFNQVLQEQYAKSVDKLKTRTADLDAELAHLKLNPEERIAKLNDLEAQRGELEKQFAPQAEIADQIRRLRAQARKAKAEGNAEAEAQLNAKIEDLKSTGGEDFAAFKQEEAKLKKAARQVNLGYGGLQSKADRVSQQLTDLTHSNFKSLNRLVARGQKLSGELQKLDPEKLRTRISDLRSEFYGLVTRSEQAQDRIAKQLQELKPEEQAGAKTQAQDNLTRRDRIKAATVELDKTAPGEFKTVEPFPDEPGYHRFRYITEDGTVVGGNYTIDGDLIENFNVGDASNPTDLGPKEVRKLLTQMTEEHQAKYVHGYRKSGARQKEEEIWFELGDKGVKFYRTDPRAGDAKTIKGVKIKAGEAPDAKAPSVEPQVEKLTSALAAERSRTERLSKISDRLQAAEAVDNSADLAEVKNAVDELVQELSNKSLGRGERATELLDRLSRLDPKKVDEHITNIEQLKRDIERKFHDQWEVKRLGEGVGTEAPDFSAHAKDMAQEVYDSITGNDYGSASVDPSFHLSAKSGPLKDRTFHIPDEKIEPYLESNVTKVMTKFARTMSAQIELARKFPDDPLLKNRFEAIKNEYDILVNHAQTDKERIALQKDMKGTFRDLRALLEIHRGSYMQKENGSSWGRAVRGTMLFNYIRSMGGSVLPSLADIYGPAIFHGFTNTMSAGVPALVKAVSKQGQLIREAKYAGVAERLSHHRLLTLTEIGDPYANGTAVERFMENGSKLASKWNGLNMLTDFQKDFDAIVVQDRLNTSLLKGSDDKFLAYSGMGPDVRNKVADQLRQHMTEEDGITVANTDQWDNYDAVRAYRAAINFNVNADIVTRGVGDVPLFAYHPLGKLLLQFKTFNLAAHQRTFLRAAQLGPAQFASGLIGLTTIGMFASYLRALRGGKESFERFQKATENPGYWIGEGLDATGFFTLPIEVSNIAERASERAGVKFNPVKTPLMLAGKLINPDASLEGQSLARPGQRTMMEALAGPTGGLIEDVPTGAGGTAFDLLQGETPTSTHKRALNRIIPYQSYLGMREALQYLEGNSPYVESQ